MRGYIVSRSKGSWSIVIDHGRDADGKRHQKWVTVRGRRKDAEAELAKILHSMNAGTFVEPSKMTVAEYLDYWLENHSVSAKTRERYEEIIKKHLSPALGHFALSKLSPLHIQRCYSDMLTQGRKDGSKGLSARTVLHHHRLLHCALKQAVRWQLIPLNPADAVDPPRPSAHEIAVPNASRIRDLLRSLDGTDLWLPTLLAVTTGLRRGEVLAVRWCDIDLDAGRLTVNQAVEQTRQRITFKEPKTARSRRTVSLPGSAIDALRKHKVSQQKQKLLLGEAYEDSGLVCAAPDGRVRRPDSFTSHFRHVTRKLGFTGLRFHDLRHAHATLLVGQGTPLKVVSERLGHSGIAITADTYSHVLNPMQEQAAEAIDTALFGG